VGGLLGRLVIGAVGVLVFLASGFIIAISWTYDSNVSAGDCSYEGTCTDQGVIEAIGWTWLAIIAMSLLIVLSAGWSAGRAGSESRLRRPSWWARRYPLSTTAAVAGLLAACLAVQVTAVAHMVNRSGSTAEAAAAVRWNTRIVLADLIALATLGLLLLLKPFGTLTTHHSTPVTSGKPPPSA
jgi:hypothetical protein